MVLWWRRYNCDIYILALLYVQGLQILVNLDESRASDVTKIVFSLCILIIMNQEYRIILP